MDLQYLLRHPEYHLIRTIRPLTEVPSGVRGEGSTEKELLTDETRPTSWKATDLAIEGLAKKTGLLETTKVR